MLQPCPVFGPSPSTTQFPVPLGPITPTTVPNVPPEVICSEKEVRVSLVDTFAPVTIILTRKPPDPSGPPGVKVNVTPTVAKQLLLEAQVSALAAPASPKPSRAKTAMLQKTLFIRSLISQVHTVRFSSRTCYGELQCLCQMAGIDAPSGRRQVIRSQRLSQASTRAPR